MKIYNRPSIFRDKVARVQGMISKAGATAFEQRRKQLAKLAGWDVKKVSDADVIEYMARGEAKLSLVVVPDSGTGELTGLSGSMAITITDGQHHYEFEFTLPSS